MKLPSSSLPSLVLLLHLKTLPSSLASLHRRITLSLCTYHSPQDASTFLSPSLCLSCSTHPSHSIVSPLVVILPVGKHCWCFRGLDKLHGIGTQARPDYLTWSWALQLLYGKLMRRKLYHERKQSVEGGVQVSRMRWFYILVFICCQRSLLQPIPS